MKVRPFTQDDVPFIFNSWLKSFRTSPFAGVIPNHLYYEVYRTTIEDLIARGAEVLVACDSAKETRILGYICFEPNCLHYLYVKDPYLKLGVSDLLITESGLLPTAFYTFKYRQVESALPQGKWVPEIARRKEYNDGH